MENNSAKISLITVICIFTIIALVIALGIVYYLGFVKESNKLVNTVSLDNANLTLMPEKETVNNIVPNENNTNNLNTIPTSDLVTLFYEATDESANIFYAYIENGYLYYFKDYAMGNDSSESAFDFISFFYTSSDNDENMKKYSDLNNITKMKTYNIGTGIKRVPFLITESGEVYTIDYFSGDNIKIELYEGLKDYKVTDILSHSGETYNSFEILLEDGTTKTVNVDN